MNMRDTIGFSEDAAATGDVGTSKSMMAYIKQAVAAIVALVSSTGNSTADMSAVTQSESGSLAALVKNFRELTRGRNQTRIGLIVPNLGSIGSDPDNAAIYTELSKISECNYIDQTEVDSGEQDWSNYDLLIVGSDNYAGFTTSNLDDMITLQIPILVCCDAVAAFLKMGTATTQSTSDVHEYCESIGNRVMYQVFGSVGDKTLFDGATVSDRLDMSNANLAEEVLMADSTGDGNTLVVLGWLPMNDGKGTVNKLNDGSAIPASRVFGGCFLNADNLTTLGKTLLKETCRNLTQSVGRFMYDTVIASLITDINTDLGEPNDTETDTLHGKIGTDTEMYDRSLFDILVGDGIAAYPDAAAPANDISIAAVVRQIYNNLVTIAGYIDTEVTAIKDKTDNLPADPADESSLEAAITAAHGTTDGKVDAVQADMGNPSGRVNLQTIMAMLGNPDAASSSLYDAFAGNIAAVNRIAGKSQLEVTTIDLNQVAASYDLFTGTTQNVLLESLAFRLPNVNVSDDTNITSISIQTDDGTPGVLIRSTDGVKANLTAEAQIAWTGSLLIKTGTKIQLTIAGGASDVETICDVVAKYTAVTSGGYLT